MAYTRCFVCRYGIEFTFDLINQFVAKGVKISEMQKDLL